jgi:hypothetical protein
MHFSDSITGVVSRKDAVQTRDIAAMFDSLFFETGASFGGKVIFIILCHFREEHDLPIGLPLMVILSEAAFSEGVVPTVIVTKRAWTTFNASRCS